jgi:hypothetical protein
VTTGENTGMRVQGVLRSPLTRLEVPCISKLQLVRSPAVARGRAAGASSSGRSSSGLAGLGLSNSGKNWIE